MNRPQQHRTQPRVSPGFTRIDLAALMVVAVAATSMVVVAGARSHLASGLGRSLANLQAHADGYASYAADFDNAIATFTWGEDDTDLTPFPDLQSQIAQGGTEASAAQAVHIMRTAGNMPDFPVIQNWLPQVSFSHLVLAAYLGEELPSRIFASPGDPVRLGWQDGSEPLPHGGTGSKRRWLFSSSYQLPPAFWVRQELLEPYRRFSQSVTHSMFVVPVSFTPVEGRDFDEVAFPSNKVMIHESAQRFFGSRDVYWAYDEARVPMLMADGSALVRTTGDANAGWDPRRPSRSPIRFVYSPKSIVGEPPALDNTSGGDIVLGHYRWTSQSARGRDFGPEVPPIP